jgi:hypothetical protein
MNSIGAIKSMNYFVTTETCNSLLEQLLDHVCCSVKEHEKTNHYDRRREIFLKLNRRASNPANLSSVLREDEESRHDETIHSHSYYIQRRQLLTIRASMILQAM